MLQTSKPKAARFHMTWEECADRYPLLTRALQWVLIGTRAEAGCCIRDYRDGLSSSCEAVSHSGLTPADRIRHAWNCRQAVSDEHKRRNRP